MLRWIWVIFFLSSCYRDHLYVQQQWITSSYLASNFVGSPDYRLKNPPHGQKLCIAWDFPLNLFEEKLSLHVIVRLYNQEEKKYTHEIERKRGWKTYFFPFCEDEKEKEILTYKVEVYNKKMELVDEWKHQLWTNRITVSGSN